MRPQFHLMRLSFFLSFFFFLLVTLIHVKEEQVSTLRSVKRLAIIAIFFSFYNLSYCLYLR